MEMVPYICLGALCVILGVLNVIFNRKTGWQGIVVRGLAVLSLLAFSIIVSSLKGIVNALPMYISLGLAVLMMAEIVYVSMTDDDKMKPVINGLFFAVSAVMFALSTMSLAEFSLFALVGGLLAGIGFGLITCAFKQNKGLNRILMNILTFACIGLIIGLGINAVMISKHMISSICVLAGGALLLVHRALVVCGKGKVAGYLASVIGTLALIAITISIYFY